MTIAPAIAAEQRPEDHARRTAVISGGSRGLGELLARRLLEDGWRVAAFSRNGAQNAENNWGDRFHHGQADLSSPESLTAFVGEVVARFGRIDLLINNAGALTEGLLVTTTRDTIKKLIDVNLIGPILLTQACVRSMMARKQGAIINVSSINSTRGHPGVSVYTASKAGLDGFTRSMARELGPLNIRVNSVVPGFFATDLVASLTPERRDRIARRTPLKRLSGIEEIANVVMFLASDKSSFVTGQTIIVDGGYTC
jgi:3-oxoacyl-[acyl-carrier protein] reductase